MGKVYLICNGEYFKIGVTNNDINKRLSKLQTGSSEELWVRDIFETSTPFKLENMLHKKYKSKQIKNEWFDLNAKDVVNFKKTCEHLQTILNSLSNNPFVNCP